VSDTFEEPTSVAFHFDVMCPYAFQTSLWMRDVRDQLGLQVDWRFFSLEEVNREEGKKHPWEREWSYGWSMMRIGALLRRTDMALLDQWYLAAGTALRRRSQTAPPRGRRGAARRDGPRPGSGRPSHRGPDDR
jgi:2-hydroxychromene-2-carboxylate isomerase